VISARHRARLSALALVLVSACTSDADDTARTPAAPPSVAHPELWPVVEQKTRRDERVEQRVEALLRAMSLEARVGQVIQADINSVTPAEVREYRLGSVLNGGNSGPGGKDLAPTPEWLALADAFYDASMASDPAIPVLWGTDAVHGHTNIVGATIFPHNIGLGATRNPGLVRRIGEITAREIRVTGQDWTFAPTLAVVSDSRWGRTYESYSEDPGIVRSYSAAMVEGLQGEAGAPGFLRGERVLATAKHYLGDGGTFEGRDQGDNRSSEQELRDVHGAGYVPAIAAGVQTVMASYSSWQGQKLHGHEGLLTGVLKRRMGFDGIVVGDWNGHGQVAGCTNTNCARALNAGIDLFMAPDSWKGLYESLLAQARSGEIPRERLDDAVRRILRVKVRSGLFEAGRPSLRPLAGRYELLGAREHRAVARQAVRESLVLLKNGKRLLPLQPKQRVLVAGDGADDLARQSGGWTITWQGTGVDRSHFPGSTSILEGIREAVTRAGGSVQWNRDATFTEKPDVAIVVYGEEPYAEFQGDVATLEYRGGDKRELAMLKRLRDAGIPVVSVFLSGRPLWVNPQINASDAFVAAWLPGSEGAGIAEVLFRRADGAVAHDFKGKLPFSWPRTPIPGASATEAKPQFPLGHGLTYADAGDLASLEEDVPRESAAAADARTFYSNGTAGRGWRLFAVEQDQRVDLSAKALPFAGGRLHVSAADRYAQEDLRNVRWNGKGEASFAVVSDNAVDLQRESNSELSLALEYRVNRTPSGPVTISVLCGERCGAAIPVTDEFTKQPGEWRKLRIMLNCFERAGTAMRNVTTPAMVSTAGELDLSIATIRLETGIENTKRCDL
jgi:beta-glucosidase